MRSSRTFVALLTTVGVLSAVVATASATTTGISITTALVTQAGNLTFTTAVGSIACSVTMTKTLIIRLIEVQRFPELTKLGKVTSGKLGARCPAQFLNLPTELAGEPTPGPEPSSWDVSFLSSDLVRGELNFGVLDFQVQMIIAGSLCLYRGTLLGTLQLLGRQLLYFGIPTLALLSGVLCPMELVVRGELFNNPPIRYELLT